MKKTISLLLAVLLLAGLLVGCGGGGEEKASTEPSSAPSGTTSTEPTGEPTSETPPAHEGAEIKLPLSEDIITLDWWHPDTYSFEGYNGTADNVFFQWMEEKTNVHINWLTPPASGQAENFSTMLLSNDYPDFVSYVQRFYTGGVDKAIADGFLLNLNEPAEEYMPNYLKHVYRDEDTFMQCVSDSGNLWGIHCILDRQQGSWIGTGIRSDWLSDAGLTTADVETMDGLENALTVFKDYTTDGQGPLFLSTGSSTYSGSLIGSYNVTGPSQMPFLNKDGTAVYTPLEPGYKEFIGKMADWYQKGLVNRNYIAENHWATPDDYWANSYIGCADVMYASLSMIQQINASGEYPDPDFDIVAIPTPKLDASQNWETDFHCRESFNVVRVNNSLGVTTACDPLDIALKYQDFIWTDEGIEASNWGPYVGEEGDTNSSYYLDPTDANGDGHEEVYQMWMMDKYQTCVNFMNKFCIHNGPQLYIWDREFTVLSQKEVDAANTWDSVGSDWLWPDGVTLTAEEGATASGVMTSANGAVVEWAAEVITGEKSIDTYDTELVPKLKDQIGIQTAIDMYQAALSRYYGRLQYFDE